MTKQQLEHVLRASAAITGAQEFIVVGSQSILGSNYNPPVELVHSYEVDVYTTRDTFDADLIEGSIGEGSPFHTTFGYCANGVGASTAVLPDGWQSRLVRFQTPATNGAVGLCLEPNDLAISKLVAGREKDMTFLAALLRHQFANADTIKQRLTATTLAPELRQAVDTRLTIAIRNSRTP